MHPSSGPSGPPGPFHVPPVPPAPRRGAGFPLWLAVVAVLLSTAALIVAMISAVKEPLPTPSASASQTSTARPADVEAVDRDLCEEIAPLIKESSRNKNNFSGLGAPGSPERNAGITDFVERTQDWASRAQQVLDAHTDPPRYLTRSLQRYIDDMRLFVDGLRPGPGHDSDQAVWTDSIAALNGPVMVCSQLGVELWQR